MKIKTVTVLGANGAMGTNICGIFASFGNAKVYMMARDIEASQEACARAVNSVKAESIARNLIPVTYADIEKCIQESDLIMESVAENLKIKKEVYNSINEYIPEKAIIATGTSGFSVDTLASYIDEDKRSRYFGVHFFNPPYNMPLCELVLPEKADVNLARELKLYLEQVLVRDVVEVKNTAAFMGNRIGFQMINLSLQLAEKYKECGGVDYIDAIMGGFTGRAMAPLVTADFVGLDVHKAIVDNIYSNTDDYEKKSFHFPIFAQEMINEERLGRKSGAGLYKLVKNDDGTKEVQVFDIETNEYRTKKQYDFKFARQMIISLKSGDYNKAIEILVKDESQEAKICLELLVRYAVYGMYISLEYGEDIHSADTVMASGFNWVPPLCVANSINEVSDFGELANEIFENNRFDKNKIPSSIQKSKHDFRPFIKAKG